VGSAEPVEGEIDVSGDPGMIVLVGQAEPAGVNNGCEVRGHYAMTHEQALDIDWTTLINGWLAAASGR
jgi:hypothetical protein